MLIDCDTCRVRGADCADCVVTMLLGAPDASQDITDGEAAAFASLAYGGLTPPLRLVPVRSVTRCVRKLSDP